MRGEKGLQGDKGLSGDPYQAQILGFILSSTSDFHIHKRYSSVSQMKSDVLPKDKFFIIHNPSIIEEHGQLYYNNPDGNLYFICNLYTLTYGQTFTDGTTVILMNKTNSYNLPKSSSFHTMCMNYIIALEGIYPQQD